MNTNKQEKYDEITDFHKGQLIGAYMEVDSERNAVFHWLINKKIKL